MPIDGEETSKLIYEGSYIWTAQKGMTIWFIINLAQDVCKFSHHSPQLKYIIFHEFTYIDVSINFILSRNSHSDTCEYCRSFTSLEDCDSYSRNVTCPMPGSRCYVIKMKHASGVDSFTRGCVDEKTGMEVALSCSEMKGCQFGTCMTSGCLASLPCS